jgi:hypothetical protein
LRRDASKPALVPPKTLLVGALVALDRIGFDQAFMAGNCTFIGKVSMRDLRASKCVSTRMSRHTGHHPRLETR